MHHGGGDSTNIFSSSACAYAKRIGAIHSGEIALAGSRRLRATLAAAPALFAHAAVTVTKICRIITLIDASCVEFEVILASLSFCCLALFQFTMEGTPESRGMNYRALDCLFQLRDERAVDTRFDVSITLLEIYNEEIRYVGMFSALC
jgi:hypothetical protein